MEVQKEISTTLETISRIESEIFALKRDISDKDQQALVLRSQIEGATAELMKQREGRHMDQQEIDRLTMEHNENTRRCADLDARISVAEHDLRRLQEHESELRKVLNSCEINLGQTCEKFDQVNSDLLRGRAEVAQNDNDHGALKRAFELKMEEKMNLVKRSEVESVRNRDISQALDKVCGKKS